MLIVSLIVAHYYMDISVKIKPNCRVFFPLIYLSESKWHLNLKHIRAAFSLQALKRRLLLCNSRVSNTCTLKLFGRICPLPIKDSADLLETPDSTFSLRSFILNHFSPAEHGAATVARLERRGLVALMWGAVSQPAVSFFDVVGKPSDHKHVRCLPQGWCEEWRDKEATHSLCLLLQPR